MAVVSLFLVFLVSITCGQLYLCNHLQYVTDEIDLIDKCITSSSAGIISSRMISCDESGFAGIAFSEKIYNDETCAGIAISTQQISRKTVSSYNCAGGDCAEIFRLYENDGTLNSCTKGADFEDIAVVRGWGYMDSISNSCISYDCSNKERSVSITDCFESSPIINYMNGICNQHNQTYFDDLIYCGPNTARSNIIPRIPTKSPTASPSSYPSNKPTLIPTTFNPTPSPILNMTVSPTTARVHKTTDWFNFISSLPEITQIDDNNIGNKRITDNGNGKIDILPAIPIEAISFVICMFLLIIIIYYLYINNDKESKTMKAYLQSVILLTFIFNIICIISISTISIVLQLFRYNSTTQEIVYIPYYGACISYVLAKFCLELVFILRVYAAFRNTVFRLKKNILYILFISMIIVSILWLILLLSDNRYWSYSYHLYILVTILDSLLIIVILYLFIKRLQTVIIRETITMRDVPTTKQTEIDIDEAIQKEAIKYDLKSQNESLLFVMTKLVLLSSISLITTTIFGVYLFYELFVDETFIVFILWSIHICINSICLFLNFGFANNIYKTCCNLIHKQCQNLIEHIFVSTIIIKQQQQNE